LFRLNEFTAVFQEIVNTYGVPTYKEVNPSVFACVTFPFLFGIMFGDIAHGLVLFLVGAVLCLFDGPIKAKAPGMSILLQLRYIILLMGFFATFCGIVYNDFMAIPIWAFESCYDLKDVKEGDPEYIPPHG
jgi:V-type H+-transporting ATPase subunit a